MSLAYVSSPGVPGIRPKNLSGDGTVSEAGMWSTSSVVTRGSWRYCLISLVYSSSIRCAGTVGEASVDAFAFLLCASRAGVGDNARVSPSTTRLILAKRDGIENVLSGTQEW